MAYNARDLYLAGKAKLYGANFSLRIILECRRRKVPISAGFALIEGESNFENVFGHDPTTSIPSAWKGGEVTETRYKYYKQHRSSKGMQGVGPAQLTWWAYQDRADRLGGCWKSRWNIDVGIAVFADHFHNAAGTTKTKLHTAARKYNGSGDAALVYANRFMDRYNKWHRRLT